VSSRSEARDLLLHSAFSLFADVMKDEPLEKGSDGYRDGASRDIGIVSSDFPLFAKQRGGLKGVSW